MIGIVRGVITLVLLVLFIALTALGLERPAQTLVRRDGAHGPSTMTPTPPASTPGSTQP